MTTRGTRFPRRQCPQCEHMVVVRPDGSLRVHPNRDPRCPGSGDPTAPTPAPRGGLRNQRLKYLQLLLDLIARHGYQPTLCDRVERVMSRL